MSPSPKPIAPNPRPIDPGISIGHVHLKVADLNRAIAFYCGVLGFDLMQRYGHEAAFLSAGGYHHHVALNTWESKGGSPPPLHTTGLYHVAIRYPTRAALADALRRLIDAGISLEGASDHGVSEALYLRDPDSNGVELAWDRPEFEDVIGISLDAPCVFRFRRKQGTRWERASIGLQPRSSYLLRGPARWDWQHSIPAVDNLRYSINFRSFRE